MANFVPCLFMYQGPKKISAFGLLLLVAIPLFFSVGILVKQKILHYQRNQKFDKEILQTITVSSENIYWVKPGKEILYDGKLFDVKSFKTEGNSIFLLGFFDHKEDKLVQEIVKLAQQKIQSGSPFSNSGIKFLFFPVYINQLQIIYTGYWKFISQQYYCFDEMILVVPGHSLTHPPQS